MVTTDPRVIALVGFMGAGKSAVGRLLASRLGARFVDADAELERHCGRRIADIFAADGESVFRSLEHQRIADVIAAAGPAPDRLVLSLGGGALGDAGTRAILRERAVVVHLFVSYDGALARVGGDPTRPILARPDLEQVYRARLPVYRACCDLEVATEGRAVRQVLAAVATELKRLDDDRPATPGTGRTPRPPATPARRSSTPDS